MENYKDYKLSGTLHAPFSPMLMEFKIPQPYIDLLNNYGDKISKSDKKSKQLDWSDNLVGNVKQEHKIEDHIWQEKPNEHLPSLFNWMGACVNLYVKTKLKSNVPIARRSGFAISSARSLSNVELQLVTRL